MSRGLVVGDLRVQPLARSGGRRSFTIVWPEGAIHEQADRFLQAYEGSGTQRTYAYLLLDHLRWLEREALACESARLRDLERYMAAVGARLRGPYGQPWRVGKRPYGPAALSAAAACVKGFYLCQASAGVNQELGSALARTLACCPRGPTARVRCSDTPATPFRPIRLPRCGHGGGIRRCCPTTPANGCSRRSPRPAIAW